MDNEKIDIPQSTLFFIKRLRDRLKEKKWTKTSNQNEIIAILTRKYRYSYDVIRPIERFFSKDNWRLKMYKYEKKRDTYIYMFRFEKIIKIN